MVSIVFIYEANIYEICTYFRTFNLITLNLFPDAYCQPTIQTKSRITGCFGCNQEVKLWDRI
jgi:hypothetical protein